MEEKRKYPRYKLSFPIECKRPGFSQYFYTVTKDLSLGGARIVTNDFFPKDGIFKVSLNMVKQIFNFKAKVSWCNQERFSDRYSLGCEFIEIPQIYKNQYQNFLNTVN